MKSRIFEPGYINKLKLNNKMVMLAMHTGFSPDYKLSERDYAFYTERARGGAGLVTIVAAITKQGAIHGMPIIDEESIKDYKKLGEMVREAGSRLMVQIFHCGRNGNEKTLGGLKPIAPSSVSSPIYKCDPIEMTQKHIDETLEAYYEAARCVKAAGADVIEISATVGYLLTQFISPVTNLRTDEYGVNHDYGLKFPMEAVRKVRKAVGEDFPVVLRVSGAQVMPGGYGVEPVFEFVKRAEKEKLIDAVNVTGNWHESSVPQITYMVPKGAYAYMADQIKRNLDIPVIFGGRLNTIEAAEKVLENEMCDFVATGRGFLVDPHFINKYLNREPYNICQGCMKCIEQIFAQREVICCFNPEMGKEYLEAQCEKFGEGKKALVIGGGPAGLEAAKKAAERGYKVTLVEASGRLGGQVNIAAKVPYKQDMNLYIDYMEFTLKKLDVEIVMNTNCDAAYIKEMAPDYVVVATGSKPILPNIKGIKQSNVYMAEDVIDGNVSIGKIKKGSVLIIGGGSVGLETAEYICEKAFTNPRDKEFFDRFDMAKYGAFAKHEVTVAEMGKRVGRGMTSVRHGVMGNRKESGVKILTETSINEICEGYVVTDKGDKISADSVIIAAGRKPVGNGIADYLEENKIKYDVLGDAVKIGDITTAHAEAFKLFLK